MISAALAAFLLLQAAAEPSKAADPRAEAASPQASAPQAPKELTPAGLDRLEHLSKMSGEERAQALADLPPAQRVRIQKGLERLDALSPEQREGWFSRYRKFNDLPAKQKDEVRVIVKELLALPLPRQKAIRDEIETYRHMPGWARDVRMRSADFQSKFNPTERDIIRHSASLLHEPGQVAAGQ